MAQIDNEGTFDIFRQHELGPIWVKAVEGREEALRSIAQLRVEQPTEVFLLWNSRTRRFVDPPSAQPV